MPLKQLQMFYRTEKISRIAQRIHGVYLASKGLTCIIVPKVVGKYLFVRIAFFAFGLTAEQIRLDSPAPFCCIADKLGARVARLQSRSPFCDLLQNVIPAHPPA